jgi:hypothetical protein
MKTQWLRSVTVFVLAVALGTMIVSAADAAKVRGPIRWSAPRLVENGPPFGVRAAIDGVACPTATTCVGAGRGGAILTLTPSATGVRVDASRTGLAGAAGLAGISCPSGSLCVAHGVQTLVVSSDPTALRSRWRRVAPAPPGDSYSGVTCPTAGACVAWTDSRTLLVSGQPTGGSRAWHRLRLAGLVDAVGCVPATTECVAAIRSGAGGGEALATTTDPTGGAGAWRVTRAAGLTRPAQIECPTSALCVAVGAYPSRTLETSTDPAQGASTWHASTLALGAPAPNAFAIGCPSAGRCLITLDNGSVATSTDPAGGARTYVQSAVVDPERFGGFPAAIACPTTGTCLVPTARAGVDTIALGPPVSVTAQRDLAGQTAVTGLACPARQLCVGVDNAGELLRTTRPTGPAPGWQRLAQPGTDQLSAITCPTVSFCAAVGDRDTILTTGSPGTDTSWQLTRLNLKYEIDTQDPPGPFRYDLGAVSCPSAHLCVAGTNFQGVIVSTRPTAGRSAWRYEKVVLGDDEDLDAVSCPTVSLCVAGDDDGDIGVSTRPAAATNTWRSFPLARPTRGPDITSLSCPSTRLCVGGTGGGLEVSTRPTRGRHAWRKVALPAGRISAVWCRSARFCVATGGQAAYASTHPSGTGRAWHRVLLATPAGRRLRAVGCAPTRVCVATGGGSVFPGTS